MRTKLLSFLALALLALAGAASAAESTGHYYTYTISKTKTDLANGNTSAVWQFYILGSSNNANDPQNNTAGNCTGHAIVSSQGKPVSESGMCFRQDSDGDSFSYWWKMDEAGTARCPDSCGSFGYVDGTGKFKGLTGGGTYVHTHDFAGGGSSGTYKDTYKMP